MSNDALNTHAMIRAGLVPYITCWSGERPTRTPVVAKGRHCIGYRRERQGDRDAHGVLWARYVRAPGVGEPEFGAVHPYRQRQAMRRLLCQVCGEPADQNDQGVLWLLGQADRPWSGSESTSQPPVCLHCAGPASRVCPHLRGNALALRVRHAPIAGVLGILYAPGRHGPVHIGPMTLPYTDPRVRMLQARQLIRNLLDCTLVNLEQELASRSREASAMAQLANTTSACQSEHARSSTPCQRPQTITPSALAAIDEEVDLA
jgi:hypothetical protein